MAKGIGLGKDAKAVVAEEKNSGRETEKTEPSSYVDDPNYWISQIEAALKREQDYRKEGDEVIRVYECENPETHSYNILYSNTETMAPALYNSTPVPVVKRRFDDTDPLGAKAAIAGERTLKYLSDDGMSEDATFDELMQAAVLSALLPGRGLTRFEYQAQIGKRERPKQTKPDDDPNAQHAADEYEVVENETVCGYDVPWDFALFGYARQWKDTPWVAFFSVMTRDELIQNFGEELGMAVPLDGEQQPTRDGESSLLDKSSNEQGLEVVRTASIWTIWDKASKRVITIAPTFKDAVLRNVPDPLGLTGFFPCPKPLQFYKRLSGQVPRALYQTYRQQAEELDRVTYRINKIIQALKVRGAYDSTLDEVQKVCEASDQVLVPVKNVAALQQGQTFDKAIWLWPIDKLVAVLQQLYLSRQQTKQVIFEITGIADIMRGSTQASETLGAQELKNQWGTLRLKRAQKEVARYARDCLRIMAEIAVTKFSPETLKSMTGLPYPSQQEQDATKQVVAHVQQQVAMGMPMPQIPPEMQAQVQSILSEPTWEQVKALLSDDVARSFRIDIETNSTVDAEATQDKQDIAELLNAMGQFFSSIGPLVESGTLSFDIAKQMLLAIVRRFRFGPEIEDALKGMQPPPPKPNPEEQKMKLEQEKFQLEAKSKEQDRANQQRLADHEFSLASKQGQMEMAMKEKEHQLKMIEMQRKAHVAELQHTHRIEQAAAQVAVNKSTPKQPNKPQAKEGAK